MKTFIFLLALIAIVSSIDIEELVKIPPNEISDIDYGCEIPQGAESCIFIKEDECCIPFEGKCRKIMTFCKKTKLDHNYEGKMRYRYAKNKGFL